MIFEERDKPLWEESGALVRSKGLGLDFLDKDKIKTRRRQNFVTKSTQSGWTERTPEDILSVASEPLESWLGRHTP